MRFSKLTFALAMWFSTWLFAAGPVYKLRLEAEGSVSLASAVHVGDGALVTVYHSFGPTQNHPDLKPEDWTIEVDGLEGTLVGSAPESDLAFVHVEGLDGEALTMAPEGYEPEGELTISGFPGESEELQTASGSVEGEWLNEEGLKHGLVLTCSCREGMSGGAVVDEDGVLVGVIHGRDDHQHCWCISRVVFTRFCGHLPEVCPTWRPILRVWTSNTCGPCRQFWADFDTDEDFRNCILSRFRMPRLPDGTVDKSAFNVDRHPVQARWWGVVGPGGGVPCFAVDPTFRVFGYRGKDALLVELGIISAEDVTQAPEPSSPVVTTPHEAEEPSEPTIAIGAILDRLERIEARLIEIDNSEIPASEIETIRLELNDLRSHVEGIESLRAELASMREAQLRVRIRQSNGTIIEDSVTIFDPEDSLNLQLPSQ